MPSSPQTPSEVAEANQRQQVKSGPKRKHHESESAEPESPYSENDNENPHSKSSSKKRHMACEACRKRKLKCCGDKPVCETCKKHNRECLYPDSFKKSGPKPGYLKKLEERLEMLESVLAANGIDQTSIPNSQQPNPSNDHPFDQPNKKSSPLPEPSSTEASSTSQSLLHSEVDEPYPSQEITEELVAIYFLRLHVYFNFIDRSRFQRHLLRAPSRIRPYLFYAVLTIAASASDKHRVLEPEFYHRCNKYIVRDEARGFGEDIINIQYVQTLSILSIYEHRTSSFSRAWITTGKAIRASQMINLHHLDSNIGSFYVKPNEYDSLHGTKRNGIGEEARLGSLVLGLNSVEEARRTFWSAYILDRFGSVATGWPASMNDSDISTLLPLDDSSYLDVRLDLARQSTNERSAKSDYKRYFENNSTFAEKGTDSDHRPLICRLDSLIENPGKYVRGIKSFLALTASYGWILNKVFKLMTSPPRSDDASFNGPWWSKNEELGSSIKKFYHVIPPVDPKSPDVNFVVSIHILHHTCAISLARASLVKMRSVGKESKAAPYEHQCLQSTIDLTMALRQATNLYDVMDHPAPLYCIFTAARNFLTIIKEKLKAISAVSSPSPPGSCAAAALAYDRAVIAQCKNYLDFLLTVLNVLRSKVLLAECFYEKVYMDMMSENLGEKLQSMSNYDDGVRKEENTKKSNYEKENDSTVRTGSVAASAGESFSTSSNSRNSRQPILEDDPVSIHNSQTGTWKTVKNFWQNQNGSSQAASAAKSGFESSKTIHTSDSTDGISPFSNIDDKNRSGYVSEHNLPNAYAGVGGNTMGAPLSALSFGSKKDEVYSNSTSDSPGTLSTPGSNSHEQNSVHSRPLSIISNLSSAASSPLMVESLLNPEPAYTHPTNAGTSISSGETSLPKTNSMESTFVPPSYPVERSKFPNRFVQGAGDINYQDPTSYEGVQSNSDGHTHPYHNIENPLIPPYRKQGLGGAPKGSSFFDLSDFMGPQANIHLQNSNTVILPNSNVPVDVPNGTRVSTQMSQEELQMMDELSDMMKLQQKYPDYLGWSSELSVDALVKDIFGSSSANANEF